MRKNRNQKNIFSFIKIISFYIIVVCLLKSILYSHVIFKVYVNGDSMNNTLRDSEKVWVYRLSKISFKDIVVADMGDRLIVKRCIGLPGDTIEFKNEKVYRNSVELKESYAKGKTISGVSKVTLNKDEYFLLGDNREISKDSRYFGSVKGENILGEVLK